MFKLQTKVDGSAKVSTLMGSLLLTISEVLSADLSKSIEFERKGETTIPFTPELEKRFGKITGDDILLIEECLDDLGSRFGYGVDFSISEGGFMIRIVALPPEEDKPPIDDDDDQPVQELDNADVTDAVSDQPKVRAVHG